VSALDLVVRLQRQQKYHEIVDVRSRRACRQAPGVGSRRQATDARGVLWVLGIEPEFQDAVFAPHLLVVPVVITVIEFGEIGMALDKPGLRPRDHPVRLRREDLLLHSWALAKPGIELKSHSGARDTEAVVSALPDRVEPLVEI